MAMAIIQLEQDVPELGGEGDLFRVDPDLGARPGEWAAWGQGGGRVVVGVQGEKGPRGMALYLSSDRPLSPSAMASRRSSTALIWR